MLQSTASTSPIDVYKRQVFNHVGRDFFAFQDLKANRENARYKDWFCDVNFWGNNEYNDGFSYGNWGGYNPVSYTHLTRPSTGQRHCSKSCTPPGGSN